MGNAIDGGKFGAIDRFSDSRWCNARIGGNRGHSGIVHGGCAEDTNDAREHSGNEEEH